MSDWQPPRATGQFAGIAASMRGRSSGKVFRLALDPLPDQLVAGFEAWADAVESWERPFRYIAEGIRAHHAYHLHTAGASTGPRFARLKRSYKREKDEHWPGRPTLTRTGALLAALADRRSVGHMERITADYLVVGIDPTATTVDTTKGKRRVKIIDYALAHQDGFTKTYTRAGKARVKKAKGYRPEQRIATRKKGATVVMPPRPPVRADLSATPGALGYNIRQILQLEIVATRRAALNVGGLSNVESKMAKLAWRRTR